jgi:hypothetical protein
MAHQRCIAKNEHGRRCRVMGGVNPANGYCVWHDPERKGRADRMRAKGGKLGGQRWKNVVRPPDRLETLEDVKTWASWTARGVATGVIDPKRAMEINRSLTTLTKSIEKLDLADKVKGLEAMVRKLKKGEAA